MKTLKITKMKLLKLCKVYSMNMLYIVKFVACRF